MYMNDENKTKINPRNKSVFITGVAGFIGSNLAKRLLSTVEDVKVVGLDNMNHYYDVRLKEARLNELEQFENFSFVKGNLADKSVIEAICTFCAKALLLELCVYYKTLVGKLHPPVPVDWGGKPRYNKRNDLFTAAGHEENKLWK